MIAAIEDNALGWGPVFERLPGAERHGPAFVSDLEHPLCNSVLMAPADADVDELRAVAASRGHAQLWWTRSSTPELADRLASIAVEQEEMPGMALALDRLDRDAAPPPDGITIEQVGYQGLLRDFVKPIAAAFGFDDFTAVHLTAALFNADADIMSWVAYDGDQPVGCASILVHAGVAGLYNVGVTPSHGRRGIGAAVTVRALTTAAERGIEHAILHSSAAGYEIYERLGFETLCTLRSFVTPPAPA